MADFYSTGGGSMGWFYRRYMEYQNKLYGFGFTDSTVQPPVTGERCLCGHDTSYHNEYSPFRETRNGPPGCFHYDCLHRLAVDKPCTGYRADPKTVVIEGEVISVTEHSANTKSDNLPARNRPEQR